MNQAIKPIKKEGLNMFSNFEISMLVFSAFYFLFILFISLKQESKFEKTMRESHEFLQQKRELKKQNKLLKKVGGL